jgi:hypothetical protein
MFTKEEVAEYTEQRVAEDARSAFPTPYPIKYGIYIAMHQDVYDEYIRLAKEVKALREQLDPVKYTLPTDAQISLNSLAIDMAIIHLRKLKIENETVHS